VLRLTPVCSYLLKYLHNVRGMHVLYIYVLRVLIMHVFSRRSIMTWNSLWTTQS